jgi:DnaJ-like protein/uncharacterized protein DUF1232
MKLALSLLALIYFLLPYDLFPDVFLGWGWIDDLVIFYFLWRFFYRGKSLPFGLFQKGSGGAQRPSGQEDGESGSKEHARGNGVSSPDGRQPRDPYDVLQISRNASTEEIRTAYKDLAGKYHPDKVLHLGEEFQSLAEERFKEIQAAYRELSNKP